MRRYLRYKVIGNPYGDDPVSFEHHGRNEPTDQDSFWIIHKYYEDWFTILNMLATNSSWLTAVQLLDQGHDPLDRGQVEVYDGFDPILGCLHHTEDMTCHAMHLPREWSFFQNPPDFLKLGLNVLFGGIPIWSNGVRQGSTPPIVDTSFNYPPWLAGIYA
jgi:hypothetical protein